MNPGPGFAEVLAFYTNIVGHPCQNACGFVIGDGADQTTADAISDWLAPSYKAWLSDDSHWTGIRLIVGNDGPPFEFDSVSSGGPGTGGTNFEAPQVQGLIHKGTGLSGRKYRGRMYVADVGGGHIDSFGNLTGTELTNLESIATAWFGLAGADALIGAPVLLHADATAPTTVTAMHAETKVATQRRRFRR